MRIEISAETLLNGKYLIEHEKRNVRSKGRSIISFPKDYAVIDIETTGLDSGWDEIIELSAVRVRDNIVVDTFSELVRPSRKIDEFIEQLTGITNEILSDARPIKGVLPEYLDFLGDDILVGHNVSFDINFIYDAKLKQDGDNFKNDYIDTLRIARKHLPDLKSHKLKTLLKHYNIPQYEAHRGLADATLTQEIYIRLCDGIEDKESFLQSFCKQPRHLRANDIISEKTEFDNAHPIYGKVCVFTGTLEKMLRKDAMQIVADLGGINGDGVSKSTNILVLGNNDYCSLVKDGKSNKQKKAEKLILEGQDLIIVPENVFYEMVEMSVE